MTLYDLDIGNIGIVEEINNTGNIKRRILELGLIKGTEIKPLFKSMSGNPVAYEFRGSIIAIRNEDAKKIIINQLPLTLS